jgi:hypothetical protein
VGRRRPLGDHSGSGARRDDADGQQFGIGVNVVCDSHFLEERALPHAAEGLPFASGALEFRGGVDRAEPADQLPDFRIIFSGEALSRYGVSQDSGPF